nr:H(+):Cl() exchange transporter 4 [Hymenolepis microstoma]
MASDEEMLDVSFPRQYMSLSAMDNPLTGQRTDSDDSMLPIGSVDIPMHGLKQSSDDSTENVLGIFPPSNPRNYVRLSTIDPDDNEYNDRSRIPFSPGNEDSEYKSVRRSYDEYDTIDWVKDLNKDSDRRARMEQHAKYSFLGQLLLIWDSSSGWICVGLIGALIGIFAVMIDIGVSWLSSLKEGICRDQFWLNQEQCCWSFNMTVFSPLYGSFSSINSTSPLPTTSSTPPLMVTDPFTANSSFSRAANLTTASSNTTMIIHPHIAGSGAQAAFGFYSCEQWYSWERLLTGHEGDLSHFGAFILGWIVYVLLAIGMAGLCATLVHFLAPSAAGSGIAEVKTILGGFVIRNFLDPWTLIVKVAGLILAVSTGLCIGNDGPMVHVGACCAKILARFFPKYGLNPSKLRELISAAVAGGMGACFGAPIGGVLFSLEVASYYFPAKTLFRSFFCALAAGYVARALNPFGEEHLILLSVDHDANWHFAELIPFAILGACGGVFGALVVRCNRAVQKFRRKRCANRPITYLLILTAIFSLIAYLHPDLRVEEKLFIRKLVSSCSAGDQEDLCDYNRLPAGGFGNATVISETSLVGSFPAGPRMGRGVTLLVGALLFKFVGMVLVYGVPVPTGVMLPSIMVGSILGRLMGITVEQLVVNCLTPSSSFYRQLCKPGHPCIDASLYAVVGAAACLGGVTRATVSLVVIMIELIGGLSYSIPIMVASMFAKWTGDRLFEGSIYDVQIRLNQYPYLQFDKNSNKMADSFASDIMHPRISEGPLELLTENSMRLEEIEKLLQHSGHNGFPIVESLSSRHLVGFVSRGDLIKALGLDRSHSSRHYHPSSIVCFTDRAPIHGTLAPGVFDGHHPLVDIRNITDLSPTTLTQATPASTIFDVFRSLGLRQVLVTHLGRVTGIITKKDLLRFLDDC